MKKFLGIAISTLMVGSLLIGCGESDVTTTTEAAVETTSEASAPIGMDVEPMSEEISMDIDIEGSSDADFTESASDVALIEDASENTNVNVEDSSVVVATEKATN